MSDAVRVFVKRQVEFYFGDANLPNDKFMRAKANEDEDKPGPGQGWVELQLLCTFARMRQKKGELDDDKYVALVAEALADSGVVDISEDGKRVRRSTPLANVDPDAAIPRCFYAKGFPRTSELDAIMEFFAAQELGKIEAVRMRYGYDKPRKFKGSVFVEMSTEAEATAAIAKSLAFGDTQLVLKTKADYLKQKREEYEERRRQKSAGGGAAAAEAEAPKEHKKGTTLKVEGCGAATTRETLKEVFGAHGKIVWVSYQRGEADAHLFFEEEGEATKILEKMFESGIPQVGGQEPTLSAVEGEEETNQWKQVWETQAAFSRRNSDGGRGGGKRRGRGGGGGGKRQRKSG